MKTNLSCKDKMGTMDLKKDFVDERGDPSKCLVCDVYVHQQESFSCPRCRKGPLCRRHRVEGRTECASCVFDLKSSELGIIRGQQKSVLQFLDFLKFIFLICAILFIALKAGISEYIDFLRNSMLITYIEYFLALPVFGYILFFIILYNQRRKISDIEYQIRKLEVRR